ncbi:unnamed protein product [Lupinus luteus]|uniref:Uncharacterized protein n=1 Tax=Lupinus luteus TaxID=3873 RepID=A0AAV1XRP9_LUPLU
MVLNEITENLQQGDEGRLAAEGRNKFPTPMAAREEIKHVGTNKPLSVEEGMRPQAPKGMEKMALGKVERSVRLLEETSKMEKGRREGHRVIF